MGLIILEATVWCGLNEAMLVRGLSVTGTQEMFFSLLFLVPTAGHVLVIPTIVRKGTIGSRRKRERHGWWWGKGIAEKTGSCWERTSLGGGAWYIEGRSGSTMPFLLLKSEKSQPGKLEAFHEGWTRVLAWEFGVSREPWVSGWTRHMNVPQARQPSLAGCSLEQGGRVAGEEPRGVG